MFDNSRDLPDDLDRLQTLRIWHAMWLERIDRKAAALRQRQAEEERGRARRPPAPDWILELSRATGHPLAVHAGDCGMAGRRKRPIGQDDARRLLTTEGIPACPICRPDTSLHIVGLRACASPWVGAGRVAAGPERLSPVARLLHLFGLRGLLRTFVDALAGCRWGRPAA
ncbi:DUF6233 domain-containing protein [Streptomyces sp. 900105755]|uniref:DUF6233 domain-containing protein n=1 Tax=Streptomyces sp. 900105755 TaxID=3154389 RepID=UPI00332CDF68